jgi:uncharacterized membrane protein
VATPLTGVFGFAVFLEAVDLRAEARGWRAFVVFFASVMDMTKNMGTNAAFFKLLRLQ